MAPTTWFAHLIRDILERLPLLRSSLQRIIRLWIYLRQIIRGTYELRRSPPTLPASLPPKTPITRSQEEQRTVTTICASRVPFRQQTQARRQTRSLEAIPTSPTFNFFLEEPTRGESSHPDRVASPIQFSLAEEEYFPSPETREIIHRPIPLALSPVSPYGIQLNHQSSAASSVSSLPSARVPPPENGSYLSVTHLPNPVTRSRTSVRSVPTRPLTASPASSKINLTTVAERVDGEGIYLMTAENAIWTMTPKTFERYERNVKIDPVESHCILDPHTVDFSPVGTLCPGWDTYVHPEGARYFHHAQDGILTDADMFDPEMAAVVNGFIQVIYEYIQKQGLHIRENGIELVLDITWAAWSARWVCGYYYADTVQRAIFWLDPFDIYNLGLEVRGLTKHTEMHFGMEAQYWYVAAIFTVRELPHTIFKECREHATFALTDSLTSLTSTTSHTMDDLEKILLVIEHASKGPMTPHGGFAFAISRFMNEFTYERFVNLHGQPAVRLDRNQSIHGDLSRPRSWRIRMLSPLFFGAPEIQLRRLERLWVDKLAHRVSWNKALEKLHAEWQEFTLYGTVLLNANVAYLAIQSVDNSAGSPDRSPIQIASYVSVLSSIASIIMGLLLLRKNRVKDRESLLAAAALLDNWDDNGGGLEFLAVTYSLPYALLMWGMITFLGAFSLNCFLNSNQSARVTVGLAYAVLGTLFVWYLAVSWETQENADDPVTRLWRQLWHDFTGLLESEPADVTDEKTSEKSVKVLRRLRWLSWPKKRKSVDSDDTRVNV